MQKLEVKQLYSIELSGVMSSSLPVLPITLEENYPKLPDSQQVSMERETRSNPVNPLNTPFVSNSGVVGPLISSASGFTSDLQFSPISSHVRQPNSAAFIPQSQDSGTALPSTCPSHLGTFQSPSSNYSRESNEITCCQSPLQTVLDYSDEATIRNNQIQSSSIVVSDDINQQNEWWTQLANEDWKDILDETTASEPQAKVSCLYLYYIIDIVQE